MRESIRRGPSLLPSLLLGLLAIGAAAFPAAAEDCSGALPWINEFDYDDLSQGGVLDSDEFVEIAAPAGTDISDYQVLAVEGNPGGLFGLPCSTGFGVDEGEAYFTGTVPPGTILGDDTGTGVGFYVMCFTNTSEDIGSNCDVVVPGVASDSNLKNGHLFNTDPDECPDGALLLDASNAFVDSVSWEGVIPNQGPYGAYFSYDVGRDLGNNELDSFKKITGIGRATSAAEWQLSGSFGATPGSLNPGQSLVCDAAATCGNGALEAGEDCDDGNTADGDCCSATCSFESPGSLCDDGNACTAPDTCDGAGSCDAGAPVVCDDGQFCNGAESCDALAGCQAGTPVDPDDGVACTVDSCDEVGDAVVNAPDDGLCDNGLFCDGGETCDALAGCQAGTPPNTNDGVDCTFDFCDEAGDVVGHTPDHAFCNAADGQFCNGSETCDPVTGCQPGLPVDPDDGVACTLDSCDEVADTIVHLPDDGLCDDALFCNGAESCDALAGCQAGTPVDPSDGVDCTVDSCDEVGDTIVNVADDGLCDDGPGCTAGSCDELSGCVYTPIPDCAPHVPVLPLWGMGLVGAMLGSAGAIWLRDRRTARR